MKTKKKVAHTPTPYYWIEDQNGDFTISMDNGGTEDVATVYGKHNAAFIVRACNSHEKLLEALKREHNVLDIPDHDRANCETCAAISEAEEA